MEAAWEFFGGVPKYLLIDNFPIAVAGADPLHPRLTRGFLEYSQHRGFIAGRAQVHPLRDNPRAERIVQDLRERFFKGVRFDDLSEVRAEARRWCLEVAGQRSYCTNCRQPVQVYWDQEGQFLAPWGGELYEFTRWCSEPRCIGTNA